MSHTPLMPAGGVNSLFNFALFQGTKMIANGGRTAWENPDLIEEYMNAQPFI